MKTNTVLVFIAYFRNPFVGMYLLIDMIRLKYIDPVSCKWIDRTASSKSRLICILEEADKRGLFRQPLSPEMYLSLSLQIFGLKIADITPKKANKNHEIDFRRILVQAMFQESEYTE
jgi:hypothetical protein